MLSRYARQTRRLSLDLWRQAQPTFDVQGDTGITAEHIDRHCTQVPNTRCIANSSASTQLQQSPQVDREAEVGFASAPSQPRRNCSSCLITRHARLDGNNLLSLMGKVPRASGQALDISCQATWLPGAGPSHRFLGREAGAIYGPGRV